MSDPPLIIEAIVDQHAEEAAFLWLLRDAAVRAPHYDLSDLFSLDDRVEAHIDGLRIAGDPGWEVCAKGLEAGEPGEVFAAGVVALESKNGDRLEQVLAVAEAEPACTRGFVSALGWVLPRQLHGTVKDFLASPSELRQQMGLAACAVHRVDPGDKLAEAISSGGKELQVRAARAAGELGRRDLSSLLRSVFQSDDLDSRFWSTWSAVLLGDRGEALDHLKHIGALDSPLKARSMQTAIRAMTANDAKQWLKLLSSKDQSLRDVILGSGISGDPAYIPWLVRQMEPPDVARAAGEAFTMITGVDLAYDDLEAEWPEGFEAGPTENPEDNDVAMDEDEDLPWPDPALVQKWWQANAHEFTAGQRYLVGKPITAEHCRYVLLSGFQRQRQAAALELALMRPDAPLFETRAPGFRQKSFLDSRSRDSV